MRRIRRVEEEVARIYPSDKIKSPVHLSIGQEAVASGVCEALEPRDVVFGTYRSHASYLAKGGDLRAFMAELYGKVTGCARGKGGSMHMVDPEHGVMGTSAVVATTIPHAVGYALAMKLKRRDVVTVGFFGDGAVEEGVYHESLNFAALHRLPVLFVCENNLYAIHSHQRARQLRDDIHERARAYGIESKRIDDNDAEAILAATKVHVDRMRETHEGPAFLECRTYRYRQHVGPGDDFALGYRTREEYASWLERDPIAKLERALPREQVDAANAQIEAELADAIRFAEESPFPEERELALHLFRES